MLPDGRVGDTAQLCFRQNVFLVRVERHQALEGGDLGWFKEGEMVKSFSDSCFYGKVGDIKLVGSQFGLHIIEILAQSKDVKKVQVGYMIRNVEPSAETDQKFYTQASEFAGINNTFEKFNQAMKSQNLFPRTVPGLKPLDKEITGLESPRLLVKWAYGADAHDVSNVMKFGNKYVVVMVEDVKEKGYAGVEDVKIEIQLELTKQKAKTDKENGRLKIIKNKIKERETLKKKKEKEIQDAINESRNRTFKEQFDKIVEDVE